MTTAASMREARCIVITGASSGIGYGLALAAARAGFRVLAVARRRERLDALASHIDAAGGICATLACDVSAPDAPARIVAAALRAFERIDVLVNNAGAGDTGHLLDLDDARIAAQWELHVAAPLRIARAALPTLRANRGTLVFLGSGLARVPIPNYGAYPPVKAAIRAAAIQLRRELRPSGVAVTYVDPGIVATEFHSTIGIERTPGLAVLPVERVARAILRGIVRRAPRVYGSAGSGIGIVLAEWAGSLLDGVAARLAPVTTAAQPAQASPVAPPPAAPQPPPDAPQASGDAFEAALATVERRMERVNLSRDFVRDLLVPGAELDLNDVAMRWAGMPNKNERAALRDVFDALTAAGYLSPTGETAWKVVRAAAD